MENKELEKRIEFYEKKYGPYIEKRGFHNWKNLFKKPNMYEWVILIMVLLSLFMFWAYQHDIDASFQNGYNTCIFERSNILQNQGTGNQSFIIQGGKNYAGEGG